MFKGISSKKGMSLIEIMVVLAIMGVIVTLVSRNVMSRLEKSKVETTKLSISGIQTALQDYYLDNNMYPTTEQGLEALISKPTVGPEPTGYSPGGYLSDKKVPQDGWGRPFIYECDGYKYSIISLGKDRKEGGVDYGEDIIVESE
jgi:general secretion pathway protein G